MARFSQLLSLSFLLPGVILAAEQKCYGLDGTPLDDTFGPCKPGARHSGCCAIHRPAGAVDICLDNGLCMATNGQFMGTVWQDGCTDPTGKDPGCPKLCPDVRDNFDGLKKVLAWNIQTCDFGRYCCREVNDRRNCCDNATAPQIETNNIGAFQFPTSTAGLTSATPVSIVTVTVPGSSDSTPTSVAGTAVETGEPFSQSTNTTVPLLSCKPDKSGAVGGAVGGVLGAMLLGLSGVIFWMYKREKRQRKLKEHYEEQFGQNFAYRRTIVVESDSRELLESPAAEKTIVLGESR